MKFIERYQFGRYVTRVTGENGGYYFTPAYTFYWPIQKRIMMYKGSRYWLTFKIIRIGCNMQGKHNCKEISFWRYIYMSFYFLFLKKFMPVRYKEINDSSWEKGYAGPKYKQWEATLKKA